MTFSICSILLVVFVGLLFSFAVGIIANEILKSNREFKRFRLLIGSGLSFGTAFSLLFLASLFYEGTRPCGKDTVSQLIKDTPVQKLAILTPCNCGNNHEN
jgi:H+/Cl- antiporter ClcA